MKKNVLLPLVIILLFSSFQKPSDNIVFIKGEVLSGNAKEVNFKWIVDNPISGQGETFIAEIDNNSNFSIQIPIERIATGKIIVGRFYHDICLIPGDDLFITVDADRIKYSGKGAGKNNYLYQAEVNRVNNRAYYEESNKGELTPAALLESLTRFKQKRMNLLESYMDSVELEKEFVDFYKIETEVIYEDQIQGYPARYSYKTKIPQDSPELPKEFTKLNSFSNFVDDSKIVSFEYINNLRNKLYSKAEEIRLTNPSITWNDAIYVALFDSLSGKTREYVLAKWIVTELARDNYDSVAIKKFNEIEKGELAQNTFNLALDKFKEKRSLIGQPLHQEFSNTILKDTAGVSLSFGEMMGKYKGKVVYLDFWGMGCGPCRAAMPYTKKLKEKLKDEPVEFVYTSVEPVRNDNWRKVFEATLTANNHYVVENGFNSRLHRFMEIYWVPSYMIFDKEGKLIDFDADSPSSTVESTETELERTLKALASK